MSRSNPQCLLICVILLWWWRCLQLLDKKWSRSCIDVFLKHLQSGESGSILTHCIFWIAAIAWPPTPRIYFSYFSWLRLIILSFTPCDACYSVSSYLRKQMPSSTRYLGGAWVHISGCGGSRLLLDLWFFQVKDLKLTIGHVESKDFKDGQSRWKYVEILPVSSIRIATQGLRCFRNYIA